MTDYWLRSAFTNDVLVADLLIRLKHSPYSDSDSLRPSQQPSSKSTITAITTILPPRWGHRKYRSKSTKEHRGSPTTHLSWSGGGGGGGGSSSDGYDESSRPSDLSSGGRSVKVNEGASTSSHHKFEKPKASQNEQETTSMRVLLNQQTASSQNLKRIKIGLDQNHRHKMRIIGKHACRVEAETVGPQKGFVLPDLNMTPNEEDMAI